MVFDICEDVVPSEDLEVVEFIDEILVEEVFLAIRNVHRSGVVVVDIQLLHQGVDGKITLGDPQHLSFPEVFVEDQGQMGPVVRFQQMAGEELGHAFVRGHESSQQWKVCPIRKRSTHSAGSDDGDSPDLGIPADWGEDVLAARSVQDVDRITVVQFHGGHRTVRVRTVRVVVGHVQAHLIILSPPGPVERIHGGHAQLSLRHHRLQALAQLQPDVRASCWEAEPRTSRPGFSPKLEQYPKIATAAAAAAAAAAATRIDDAHEELPSSLLSFPVSYFASSVSSRQDTRCRWIQTIESSRSS